MTQRSSARGARARAHTPTARRSVRPCPPRAEPQAHPDTRRTFHEPRGPLGNDAELAWQDRAIQKPVVAPTPQRPTKASQSASSPAPAAPTPLRPAHERASLAQQHARRQSQCTHANRSPHRPTPRTAAPSPRSRAEAQEPHRRAPHLRRAAPNV